MLKKTLLAISFSGIATAAIAAAPEFTEIDTDGDSLLTLEEISPVMSQLSMEITDETSDEGKKEFFDTFDMNQDGSIDMDEYANLIQVVDKEAMKTEG